MTDPLLSDPNRPIRHLKFGGSITPLREQFPYNIEGAVVAFMADDGHHLVAAVDIIGNSINASVQTQSDENLTVRNHLHQVLSSLVDSVGFIYGRWFETDIENIDDDRISTPLTTQIGVLQSIPHPVGDPIAVFGLTAELQPLRRAIADMRQAMKVATDTGFYCYRAIEDLMQYFNTTQENKSKAAWEGLRKSLQLDRSFIDRIEKYGTPQRHGKVLAMSGEERGRVMRATVQIIDRFCAFASGGFTALSTAQFPLLTQDDFDSTENT